MFLVLGRKKVLHGIPFCVVLCMALPASLVLWDLLMGLCVAGSGLGSISPFLFPIFCIFLHLGHEKLAPDPCFVVVYLLVRDLVGFLLF